MISKEDYAFERYRGSTFLEDFVFELPNSFEKSADEQIKLLEKRKEDIYQSKYFSDPYENSDIIYGMLEEADSIDEEMLAMYEMKVIYAYKLFEINVKRLIKPYFTISNGLFRWNSLETFFKSKGITFKDLNGSKELDELRLTNNNLKHSGEVDKNIIHISEFTEIGEFDLDELKSFYERVKSSPFIFLQSLADAIMQERYSFDEIKIEAIAHDLARRMEEKDAMELITCLSNKY